MVVRVLHPPPLTEDEPFAHDTTPRDEATSADENDESDPSPAGQIQKHRRVFRQDERHIRQFIRNSATQSDDAAAHFDWLEDLILSGALASSKQTPMEDFFKAD